MALINPRAYDEKEGTNVRLDKNIKDKIREKVETGETPSICAYVNDVLKKHFEKRG